MKKGAITQRNNITTVEGTKSFKHYVIGTLALFGAISSMIVFFCWIIDPYGVWQSYRFKGINETINPKGYERIYKMTQISRIKQLDTLLLGASTVYNALYPETYFNYTGKRGYNGGLNGVNVLEMKYVLEQAVYFHPELKEVIVGLNWFMFSTKHQNISESFPDNQVGCRFPVGEKLRAVLFSTSAVKASVITLFRNITHQGHTLIDEDGKLNQLDLQRTYAGQHSLESFSKDTIAQIPLFKEYNLSEQSMQAYIDILDICKENGIHLVVYINPVHSIFLESIYQSGGETGFEEWKRWLASLYPVHDFAHFSVISNEPFSEQRRYWRNTQHPMPLTGDIVLRKLTGKELPEDVGDFGFLLTEGNVAEMLEHERSSRDIWRQENSETVSFVEDLVERY